MQVKVFADSAESMENTLHFLKCYALASESIPPVSPDSLVATHRDIDALKSSGAFAASFARAQTATEPLEVKRTSNNACLSQTLASYLRRPREDVNAAFEAGFAAMPTPPAMPSLTIEGTLYETSINIPAENPIIDHYALSEGMFIVRGAQGAAVYSSIELAAQQTDREAVMQRVQDIMQYEDPMARHHDA